MIHPLGYVYIGIALLWLLWLGIQWLERRAGCPEDDQ